MSKDTFYFPHDYNARTDRKLVSVIMKHGMAGIGIYWCIVEMLYEENGYLPLEYERITFELRTEKSIVKDLILNSNLFNYDEEKFWSEAVLQRLQKRKDKSVKAKESVSHRWSKEEQEYERNTNVIRTYNDRNTINKSKIKENKEKINKKEELYFPLAKKLSEIIQTKKNIKHTTSQINAWVKPIQQLVEINEVEISRIKHALRWYENHIGDLYCPVIESGESLKTKFLSLERQMNPPTKPTSSTGTIKNGKPSMKYKLSDEQL